MREKRAEGERRIKISVLRDNDTIRVFICDNAYGIEDDIIDRIFDPYFTTKHQSQGTGLGLYISKMIIEQNMNGKLNVYNTGEGACFVVESPVANSSPQ